MMFLTSNLSAGLLPSFGDLAAPRQVKRLVIVCTRQGPGGRDRSWDPGQNSPEPAFRECGGQEPAFPANWDTRELANVILPSSRIKLLWSRI
jgi:hypothetical protein